jgi:hypothetical protein
LANGIGPRMKRFSGRRVQVVWDDCPATVVQEGPQQSEIKFDDGRVRFIINEHLVEEKKE